MAHALVESRAGAVTHKDRPCQCPGFPPSCPARVIRGLVSNSLHIERVPHYLSSDHDPLFRYHRWQVNLRILEIKKIKSIPNTPVSHPFVERLIGTIRREYLDHVFFWNAQDLERKPGAFLQYCNHTRAHQSLGGNAPAEVSGEHQPPTAEFCNYSWISHCNGLFQTPIAA